MDLPIYELFIDEEQDNGVAAIALVSRPAIERTWKAFSSQKHRFQGDAERRIISGAAMIPDEPIYRKVGDKEFNVVFSAATIEKISQKFFSNGFTKNINLKHDPKLVPEGVYVFESFLIDSARGIQAPIGYDDLPEGSWFISCKVDNDDVWNDFVATGKFTGFSVEGNFLHNTEAFIEPEKSVLEQIKDILNSVEW